MYTTLGTFEYNFSVTCKYPCVSNIIIIGNYKGVDFVLLNNGLCFNLFCTKGSAPQVVHSPRGSLSKRFTLKEVCLLAKRFALQEVRSPRYTLSKRITLQEDHSSKGSLSKRITLQEDCSPQETLTPAAFVSIVFQ